VCHISDRVKGKAIPVQAWTGPLVSRRLMLPAHEDGKFSPTHRPRLPPGNIPGSHFC